MLARIGPIPGGDGWAVEVKFDGMRCQLRRDGRAVCLPSRPGRDCTEEFPELAAIQSALGDHRVLLDASSSAWTPTAVPTSPACGGGCAPRPKRPAAMASAGRSCT
jgi:bifunctional non-homologous end joining protein LigD